MSSEAARCVRRACSSGRAPAREQDCHAPACVPATRHRSLAPDGVKCRCVREPSAGGVRVLPAQQRNASAASRMLFASLFCSYPAARKRQRPPRRIPPQDAAAPICCRARHQRCRLTRGMCGASGVRRGSPHALVERYAMPPPLEAHHAYVMARTACRAQMRQTQRVRILIIFSVLATSRLRHYR